jgi:hypothetical protein
MKEAAEGCGSGYAHKGFSIYRLRDLVWMRQITQK